MKDRRYEADLKRLGWGQGTFEASGWLVSQPQLDHRTVGAKGRQESEPRRGVAGRGSVCTDLGPSPLWLTSALTKEVANRDKRRAVLRGGQCLSQPESDSGPLSTGNETGVSWGVFFRNSLQEKYSTKGSAHHRYQSQDCHCRRYGCLVSGLMFASALGPSPSQAEALGPQADGSRPMPPPRLPGSLSAGLELWGRWTIRA